MAYTLDEFYRVITEVDLPDGTRINVRTLGDDELNAKQAYALSESAKMTEALRNPESFEYKTRLLPLVMTSDHSLIETLATSNRPDLEREALMQYRYPENATDEQKAEVDTQRAKHVIDTDVAYREQMALLDHDTLVKTVQERAILLYAMDTGFTADIYYAIWCSCRVDGQPRWNSVDDVKRLPPSLINFLTEKYREVEAQDVWKITPEKPKRKRNS